MSIGTVLREALHTPLKDYQLHTVRFIVEKAKWRGLIAEEMGLGKSLEAIALMVLKMDVRPVVVVCPASVKYHWQAQLRRHAGLRSLVCAGFLTTKAQDRRDCERAISRARRRRKSGKRKGWGDYSREERRRKIAAIRRRFAGKQDRQAPLREAARRSKILIINYNILETWLPFLLTLGVRFVVYDEAHYLSTTAKWTRAAVRLARGVPNRILLTGTPVTNNPVGFYPSLKILRPKRFEDFTAFAFRYCLIGSTLIATEHGPKRIDDLVRARASVRVWSYNSISKRLELRPAVDWFERSVLDLVTVSYEGGSFTTTPEHRVWTKENGYVAAGALAEGQGLLTRPERHPEGRKEDDEISFARVVRVEVHQRPRSPETTTGDRAGVGNDCSQAKTQVFDLTIEGNHNFFANGALVSNCAPRRGFRGQWDFRGASHLKELHRRISSFTARHRRKDVLRELPRKTRTIIPCDITNRPEYSRAKDDFLTWLRGKEGIGAAKRASGAVALVRMTKLCALAARGKLKSAFAFVEDFLEETDRSLVIFGIHVPIMDALRERWPDAPCVVGATPLKQRHREVERFRRGKAGRIFLGQLKAAGTGVDGLQDRASATLALEIPWNPGLMDQSEDRVLRIGQDCAVDNYYLIGKDTIEEWKLEVVDSKQLVVDEILEGGSDAARASLMDMMRRIK